MEEHDRSTMTVAGSESVAAAPELVIVEMYVVKNGMECHVGFADLFLAYSRLHGCCDYAQD